VEWAAKDNGVVSQGETILVSGNKRSKGNIFSLGTGQEGSLILPETTGSGEINHD
jgi:hypothetical protein